MISIEDLARELGAPLGDLLGFAGHLLHRARPESQLDDAAADYIREAWSGESPDVPDARAYGAAEPVDGPEVLGGQWDDGYPRA